MDQPPPIYIIIIIIIIIIIVVVVIISLFLNNFTGSRDLALQFFFSKTTKISVKDGEQNSY